MSDTAIMYVVLAVIVIVAILWAKSRLKLKLPGVEVGVEQDREVKVLEKAQLDSVEAGNVTGERLAGAEGPAASDVRVLNDAVIRGGKLGDITGVDSSGPEKK